MRMPRPINERYPTTKIAEEIVSGMENGVEPDVSNAAPIAVTMGESVETNAAD